MNNKIEILYSGLKCDNCSYSDQRIERREFESYINRPCPECGENLLTFNDYMNLLIVENAVDEVNNTDLVEKESEERVTIKINTHKNITFE